MPAGVVASQKHTAMTTLVLDVFRFFDQVGDAAETAKPEGNESPDTVTTNRQLMIYQREDVKRTPMSKPKGGIVTLSNRKWTHCV